MVNKKEFKRIVQPIYRKKVTIGIDPGEISGLCVHKGIKPLFLGEKKTFSLLDASDFFSKFIDLYEPELITIEDFILYGHKAEKLSWNKLHTPKLIGILMEVIYRKNLHMTFRNAQTAKTNVTDTLLNRWGLYLTPRQVMSQFKIEDGEMSKDKCHYRDAQRHCYYEMWHGDCTSLIPETTEFDREGEQIKQARKKRITSAIDDYRRTKKNKP